MSTGVPKVPYQFPGDPYSQWMDIYNRLYQDRIIFLNKEVDDEIANQIVALMLYLDSESPGKDIHQLNEIYAQQTGQTVEKIEKDTEQDFFLSAEEAKEYGLVDRVLSK